MSDNNWVDEGPRDFVRTRNRVEAVRVNEENLKTLAIWCGGSNLYSPKSEKPSYIRPPQEALDPVLLIPTLEGNVHAYLGEWLIKDQDGKFSVMNSKEFRDEYMLPTDGIDATTTTI